MSASSQRLWILLAVLAILLALAWRDDGDELSSPTTALNGVRIRHRPAADTILHGQDLTALPQRQPTAMLQDLFVAVADQADEEAVAPVTTKQDDAPPPLPFVLLGVMSAGDETTVSLEANDVLFVLKPGEQALGYVLQNIEELPTGKKINFYSATHKIKASLVVGETQ